MIERTFISMARRTGKYHVEFRWVMLVASAQLKRQTSEHQPSRKVVDEYEQDAEKFL